MTVYLSSTLTDLEAERRAVQDALGDQCIVRHSYRASEEALVESCLSDVAACDLYIGILGLRYGYVPGKPFRNPKTLSITELEYRQAEKAGIPRLVFLKDESAIPYTLTDAKTKEHPPEKIEAFRSRASAGQRAALFSDTPQLREHVLKAFNAFKEKRVDAGKGKASRRPQATTHRSSNEAVRRGYVDWLRAECEKVVLLGLDLRDRQNVRLGQVYVPALTARQSEPRKRERAAARVDPDEHPYEPLLHRLGKESLYVPGAPGSGKSTFCRWLALSVASGEVRSPSLAVPDAFKESMPKALQGRFPFFCPLRQWASDRRWLAGNGQWTGKQLEDGLAAWIETTRPGGLTSSAFREALAGGRSVIILDGVDEIPERIDKYYPRRNFLTGLADALQSWRRAGNRVLLTSRPYGVEAAERRDLGLATADLAQLPRALQDVFVHRWYAAAEATDGDRKARGLIEHLDGRPDLNELRPNPMLLTALCVKYDEDMRLPGDLFRLYSAVTDQVLYKRFNTEPERDLARLRLAAVALAMHQGSPGDPRTSPAAEVSWDEVEEALTALARTDRASEQGSTEASDRRESLLSYSGLLLPRANSRAAFYHFSFQEFFAALRLRRVAGEVREVLDRHMATAGWRRTLRFFFCAIADQASPERALSDYSVLLEHLQREHLARDPSSALLLADCLEVGHARGWNLHDFAGPYRRACDDALQIVPPPARAFLWEILGRIGLDDRAGVGVRDGLPDIDWVDVPAGEFLFGKERAVVTLPAFRIARYPVTNAQFQCFIDDGGFDEEAWWRWPRQRRPPATPSWPHVNHPRETASWFDAMAFCAWLEARLRARGKLPDGWSVRLPTEQQWEKAARGTDGREYPWGEQYESGCANIDETFDKVGPYYLRQTSAVGMYPAGASPYKVYDMAGNVWEWCLDAVGGQADSDEVRRVVRGGSWNLNQDLARASYRLDGDPDSRDLSLGFRVVCVSPIP